MTIYGRGTCPRGCRIGLLQLLAYAHVSAFNSAHSYMTFCSRWGSSRLKTSCSPLMATGEDMDEYKKQRKQQETEEFNARKDELDALRARIADMAAQNKMEE